MSTSEVTPFRDAILSSEELAEVYGPPMENILDKIIDRLDSHCRDFIALAPFVLVATADADGRCDVSPKGGPPGFVRVLDEKRLVLPDAPGNRIIDSLRNIVATGRAGLLFVIPGMEETLRVNGRAFLTHDPELLGSLEGAGKPPKVGVGVQVEEAYLHCAKAFKRSGLWQSDEWPDASGLARPAEIWRDHIALAEVSLEAVDELVDEDYRDNLWWR